MDAKIIDRACLKDIVGRLKVDGKKVVFTNGCFDILHRGHVKLLEEAKALGDKLIVAINSDKSVRRLKGASRPLNTLKDRLEVLAGLASVDYVTWFSELDPGNIIKELSPDILVKGGDWRTDEIIGKDYVESQGGRVETITFLKGYSTNSLIDRIYKRYKKKK